MTDVWALDRLHTHRMQVADQAFYPVVAVTRNWEGPALIVGEGGENILAVNTKWPGRIVITFFRENDLKGGRAECALALEEAGRSEGKWPYVDVHVFELEMLVKSTKDVREVKPGTRIGMLACPAGRELTIELLDGRDAERKTETDSQATSPTA